VDGAPERHADMAALADSSAAIWQQGVLPMIFDGLKAYASTALAIIALAGIGAATVQTLRLSRFERLAAQEKMQASEAARIKERKDATENAKITDELLQEGAKARAAAASSAQRLRDLSSAASAAASACSRLNEPAAAILPPITRNDLESQADSADEVALRLSKLQAYVTSVCR
jgi:hypothetical protein